MCKNNIFVQSKEDKDIFRIFKKKKYYKIRTVRLSLSPLMTCMVLTFGVGIKKVFIYLREIWIIPHYKRINILQGKRKSGNNSALVLAPVLYTNLLTYYVFPKKTLVKEPTDCEYRLPNGRYEIFFHLRNFNTSCYSGYLKYSYLMIL